MKKLTYFVPVDFSDCSYNALQYATMLARFSGGAVKLCHVIDLEELPESDNAVSISFALERLEHKANQKMKSLREIISLEGVAVEEEIVMGNIRLELMKQIEKVKPHIIVIGKNIDGPPHPYDMVTYITKHTRVPVLVVPGSHNPKIPNRAVLATDMRPNSVKEFAPLFEILGVTSQEISILNMSGQQAKGKNTGEWLEKIKTIYGIQAEVLHFDSANTFQIAEFIRMNRVDLVCTITRTPGFFRKLFQRNKSSQLPGKVEVPVLVMSE